MRPVGRPSDCRLSAGYLRDDRPRAWSILEVLGSRIEGEQLLEQPVGGSQLKSRRARPRPDR